MGGNAIKISKVSPWVISFPWEMRVGAEQERVTEDRQLVLVQVDTDAGITGWGEVTTYPGPVANRAIAAMIAQAGDFLSGEEANQIERLWHRTFRSFTYMGSRGATTALISAIDIALWDIRGQELGLPIYQLLGGPVRDSIAPLHPPSGTPHRARRRRRRPADRRRRLRSLQVRPDDALHSRESRWIHRRTVEQGGHGHRRRDRRSGARGGGGPTSRSSSTPTACTTSPPPSSWPTGSPGTTSTGSRSRCRWRATAPWSRCARRSV